MGAIDGLNLCVHCVHVCVSTCPVDGLVCISVYVCVCTCPVDGLVCICVCVCACPVDGLVCVCVCIGCAHALWIE